MLLQEGMVQGARVAATAERQTAGSRQQQGLAVRQPRQCTGNLKRTAAQCEGCGRASLS